jgi:Fungal specific transcription factor domain
MSCPSDPEPVVISRVKSLPEDITEGILHLSKANSTPPNSMAKALIDIYFQELYWIVPVVSRQELSAPDPSLLLLQSVYFAGGLMRRSKIWPQSSSPEEIYKKIKTLLFLDYEKDKALVLKALCLLSIWSPNGPQVVTLDCPWHWTGMALRLALQLGMHREVTHSNRESETSSSRKLWWFLFVSFCIV